MLGFVIDFRSIFLRNLDAQIMKNRAPAAARARFLRNRHFKLTSIFDSILVLTWPHFGTKNPPKSVQKPIPRVSKKLSIFSSIFWPSWHHFGTQVAAQVANKTSGETSGGTSAGTSGATLAGRASRDATQEALKRFPDGPKMLFSCLVGIFWCQLGSILASNFRQTPSEN